MANEPKIIFFDIDGTLVRSRNGHLAFNDAIFKTFGVPGDIRTIRPDGKTDPIILQEIFDAGGHKVKWRPADAARFSQSLQECYTRAISRGSTVMYALPGVLELVGALSRRGDLCLGVVTGNMEVTARLKLQAAGVGEHIGLGAFASDSPNRNDLPRIAMERWGAHLNRPVEPRHCVIVGDTPRDLEAARTNGMKCLLVATGRYHPLEELRHIEPDELLPDFSDTRAAVDALMGLFG